MCEKEEMLVTNISSFCTKQQNFVLAQTFNFADDNLNVSQKLKFALGRAENIVGKGENAGCQHFLLFPQCF